MKTSVNDVVSPPTCKLQVLRVHVALVAGILLIAGGFATYYALGARSAVDKVYADLRPLPEIQFRNGADKTLTLSDFRGRVVLINLWATWCVPCRTEMPALDRLQAKLGGPDFEVVAMSIDSDMQAVRDFYQQYGIKSLALYHDSTTGVTSALGAIGTPTTLLVDHEGREVWRRLGPAEWDAPASVAEIGKYMKAASPSFTQRNQYLERKISNEKLAIY